MVLIWTRSVASSVGSCSHKNPLTCRVNLQKAGRNFISNGVRSRACNSFNWKFIKATVGTSTLQGVNCTRTNTVRHTWARVPGQGGSTAGRGGGAPGGQKGGENFVLKKFLLKKGVFKEKNTIFERFFRFFTSKFTYFHQFLLIFFHQIFNFWGFPQGSLIFFPRPEGGVLRNPRQGGGDPPQGGGPPPPVPMYGWWCHGILLGVGGLDSSYRAPVC